MAGNRTFDETISAWLEDTAPSGLSQRVLAATFERTRSSRQRLGWRGVLGRRPMPRFIPAISGATVVVLAAVLALNFSSVFGPSAPQTPSPSTSPQPTTSMWPQTSLEEVRQAQRLADAGDPTYAWQLHVDEGQVGQNHPCSGATRGCLSRARNGGSGEIFSRFLEEELGWEAFTWDEAFAHRIGLNAGDVVFVRCAPGVANPLYPTNAEHPGCAPTIDELRYETVKVSVAQPDRQGPTGIWVVTGWEMIEPAEQVEPPSTAEIKGLVEPFLQARIAGQGADDVVDIAKDNQIVDEIASQRLPLLYASSTGDPYERSAFEIVEGPVWPQGGMQLKVRLFAANGDTEVDQLLSLARDDAGRLRLEYDFSPDVHATTENGKDVPVEYAFLDGAVTYRATYPLAPSEDGYRDQDRLAIDGLLPDDGAPRRVLIFLADPRPIGSPIGQPGVGCEVQAAPADAATLARSIASDTDFEAAPPVTVTIGGIKALQIDVTLAQGARDCQWSEPEISSWSPLLLEHAPFMGVNRARLFLLDLPGGSARVLAIAVITDDDSFDTVLGWAIPVINSIQFHTS